MHLLITYITFAVAHRLRTISDCDIIFVLKDGKVHESGTHSSLLSHDGLYRDLWESQSTLGSARVLAKESTSLQKRGP